MSQKFSVKQGHKYKITVKLGILESLATDGMIKEKFTDNGFINVKNLPGSNLTRYIEGVWSKPDVEFNDLHIHNVEEIEWDSWTQNI